MPNFTRPNSDSRQESTEIREEWSDAARKAAAAARMVRKKGGSVSQAKAAARAAFSRAGGKRGLPKFVNKAALARTLSSIPTSKTRRY